MFFGETPRIRRKGHKMPPPFRGDNVIASVYAGPGTTAGET